MANSGKTLTRADLAEAVFQKVGLPRNESSELVESVIREMIGCLERGENVKLSSFGSFGVRDKRERVGRNPKTGEVVPIRYGQFRQQRAIDHVIGPIRQLHTDQ